MDLMLSLCGEVINHLVVEVFDQGVVLESVLKHSIFLSFYSI